MSLTAERMFVLYDIPSQHPSKAWSFNSWKVRLVLNYKGLPHRTVWVEYPEIEPTLKPLGAQPTGTRNGQPLYTIPTIHDLSNGQIISDSFKIAKYLDDTYPDTTPVLPEAARGLTRVAHRTIQNDYLWWMTEFMIVNINTRLNPASAEFHRNRIFDIPFNKMVPTDPGAREKVWNDNKRQMDLLDAYYGENNTSSGWIMGESPTFIDFVLAAHFILARLTIKDEFEAHVGKWHNRRWTKLTDELEKYSVVY